MFGIQLPNKKKQPEQYTKTEPIQINSPTKRECKPTSFDTTASTPPSHFYVNLTTRMARFSTSPRN
jgi:hypothetical protein